MSEVTIIIPAYNAEESIAACLDSVLNQTYHNWKAIIADNGSTDTTSEIVTGYTAVDSRFSLIHVAEKGVSNARNAALDAADSKYICFVDSDDVIDSTYLEVLLSHKADLIVCGYAVDSYRLPNQLLSSECKCPPVVHFNFPDSYCENHMLQVFREGYMHFCWNKLYTLDIIKRNKIRFQTIPVNEDFIFTLEYLAKCRSTEVIKTPLYHWIRYEGRKSGVTSLPINLVEIYNYSQILLRELFKDYRAADQILYHTYELIVLKYYNAYQTTQITLKELRARLNEFKNNELVKSSFSAYTPCSRGDRVLYRLMKKGYFGFHYLLTQKLLK